MNTQHTPGPWQTGTYNRGRFCVYAPKSNGRGICVMSNTQPVRPEEVAKYGEHGLNLEADANARLIASAPDLLELAKHILALETDPYLQGHPEWEAFLNEAQAAIAKTEGQESAKRRES